jgi:hypothetical protein
MESPLAFFVAIGAIVLCTVFQSAELRNVQDLLQQQQVFLAQQSKTANTQREVLSTQQAEMMRRQIELIHQLQALCVDNKGKRAGGKKLWKDSFGGVSSGE